MSKLISDLYNVTLKRGLRSRAKNGFVRPTICEHFYSGCDYDASLSGMPKASFTSDLVSGDEPLTVQFTDESTGDITDYLWDFGDGETSTGHSPSHVFASNGVYTVSLTTTGPSGSDVEIKTGLVTV